MNPRTNHKPRGCWEGKPNGATEVGTQVQLAWESPERYQKSIGYLWNFLTCKKCCRFLFGIVCLQFRIYSTISSKARQDWMVARLLDSIIWISMAFSMFQASSTCTNSCHNSQKIKTKRVPLCLHQVPSAPGLQSQDQQQHWPLVDQHFLASKLVKDEFPRS